MKRAVVGLSGRAIAASLFCFALGACGGSGSHPPVPGTSASPATIVAARATATLAFTIPARTASAIKRKPAFVSSASTQLSVTAQNTLSQTVVSTPQLATYCVAQPDGSRACSVPAGAPLGNVTFTVVLQDSSSDALAIGSNASPVTIVEGTTTVTPFITLNPIPAVMSATVPVTPHGSTAGVPMTLSFGDAGGAAIGGTDPLITGSNLPISLTLSVVGTANAAFSTAASCSPTATTFPNWTVASKLYYCPGGTTTLGTVNTAQLSNGVQTGFNAAQALYSPVTFSSWHSLVGLGGTQMTSLSGNDTDGVYAMGICCSLGHDVLAEGSYSIALTWPTVGYATFDLYPAYQTPGLGFIMASWIDQGNGPGEWGFSPTVYLNVEHNTGTLGNAVALTTTYQPAIGGQVYAAVDNSTIQQISWSGGIPSETTSVTLASIPHNIAVGPLPSVFVGFDGNTNVGSLNSNAGGSNLLGSTVTNLTTDATYTGTVVAGNVGAAYAIAYGSGKNLEVYSLTATTATLVSTFTSSSDQLPTGTIGSGSVLTNAYTAAVGNDGRLYMVVKNGTASRIVAYDPIQNVLVDPAISVSSLDATRPMVISTGQAGSILVGGTLSSDLDVGVVQYP